MNNQNNNEIFNPNAVIYCRVSTGRQVEEGGSLTSQERICRDYAEKHAFAVVRAFIEKGESAKTADRTALNELLDFCKDKKNSVGTVIFYKIDRFSRYTDDYSDIRRDLRKNKIRIRSATETFDDTPSGKLMENMLITLAQFDNDVRAERCAGGMRDAMREGRYVWAAPYGYDNIRINGRANIVQNEKADLVRKTFYEIAKNVKPAEEVRRQINKEGLTNKRGKFLCKSQFYRLLKNETYAGWIIKFGERHRGTFEPIVPEPIFAQVQAVLDSKKRKNHHYNTENPSFPLRRFFFHPQGGKLSGGWSKGRHDIYPYYRYHKPTANFQKESVEKPFKTFFNKYAFNPEHITALIEGVKKHLDCSTIEQQKERTRLEKNIVDLKEKQTSLIQKNLNGVLNDSILRDQLGRIDIELMNIQSILAAIPEQKAEYAKIVQFVQEFLKNPSEIWAKSPFATQLRLQWFAFPKGISFDGTNCRTTEVCRLFKDKKEILASLSHKVDFMHSTANQKGSLIWQEIGYELITLEDILHQNSNS